MIGFWGTWGKGLLLSSQRADDGKTHLPGHRGIPIKGKLGEGRLAPGGLGAGREAVKVHRSHSHAHVRLRWLQACLAGRGVRGS